jgi:hypothetical protein
LCLVNLPRNPIRSSSRQLLDCAAAEGPSHEYRFLHPLYAPQLTLRAVRRKNRLYQDEYVRFYDMEVSDNDQDNDHDWEFHRPGSPLPPLTRDKDIKTVAQMLGFEEMPKTR